MNIKWRERHLEAEPPTTLSLLCGSVPRRAPALTPTMPAMPSPPHRAERPTMAGADRRQPSSVQATCTMAYMSGPLSSSEGLPWR